PSYTVATRPRTILTSSAIVATRPRTISNEKKGGEQASDSTPSEKATRGAGGSTTGSQSRQKSASESAYAEEPVQTTCQMEETPHPVGTCADYLSDGGPPHSVFETGADDQPIYPHNLLQPLPLIPDNRGRRVILFEHFINNDLEYLRGGTSSRKYTTSVTKIKAADYGHIKWIEDLVPREMWIQQPIDYNKHVLWGVSHWGRKRKQFYGEDERMMIRKDPPGESDRGSKRQREEGEHVSASTPSEPATGSAGRTTTGSQSRQLSASEFAFAEEPMQPTCQMGDPHIRPLTPNRDWNKSMPTAQGEAQSWISTLAKQTDACSSFNELLDT
nr:hypothetical protein [Tanacetum cinerariifolium]